MALSLVYTTNATALCSCPALATHWMCMQALMYSHIQVLHWQRYQTADSSCGIETGFKHSADSIFEWNGFGRVSCGLPHVLHSNSPWRIEDTHSYIVAQRVRHR